MPDAAAGRQIVERRGDVVPDRQIFDHLLGLKGAAQAECGAPVHGDTQQIDAVHNHCAGSTFDETAHGVQQRRFAGAVRSNQTGDLGADIGGQIVQAAHAAESDRQVADLDHSFRSMARGMTAESLVLSNRPSPTT